MTDRQRILGNLCAAAALGAGIAGGVLGYKLMPEVSREQAVKSSTLHYYESDLSTFLDAKKAVERTEEALADGLISEHELFGERGITNLNYGHGNYFFGDFTFFRPLAYRDERPKHLPEGDEYFSQMVDLIDQARQATFNQKIYHKQGEEIRLVEQTIKALDEIEDSGMLNLADKERLEGIRSNIEKRYGLEKSRKEEAAEVIGRINRLSDNQLLSESNRRELDLLANTLDSRYFGERGLAFGLDYGLGEDSEVFGIKVDSELGSQISRTASDYQKFLANLEDEGHLDELIDEAATSQNLNNSILGATLGTLGGTMAVILPALVPSFIRERRREKEVGK